MKYPIFNPFEDLYQIRYSNEYEYVKEYYNTKENFYVAWNDCNVGDWIISYSFAILEHNKKYKDELIKCLLDCCEIKYKRLNDKGIIKYLNSVKDFYSNKITLDELLNVSKKHIRTTVFENYKNLEKPRNLHEIIKETHSDVVSMLFTLCINGGYEQSPLREQIKKAEICKKYLTKPIFNIVENYKKNFLI